MANNAYVRVSTREQNIDRQLAALKPYKIPKRISFVITSPAKTSTVRSIRSS